MSDDDPTKISTAPKTEPISGAGMAARVFLFMAGAFSALVLFAAYERSPELTVCAILEAFSCVMAYSFFRRLNEGVAPRSLYPLAASAALLGLTAVVVVLFIP